MHPILITVFDSESGTSTEYSFEKSPIRIGRNPLNDLSLPFPFVSGWHAVVRFDANEAKFYDLGSTNGTLVAGRQVQAGESIPVAPQVAVTIGKLELRIRRADAGVSVAAVSMGPPPVIPTSAPQIPATAAAIAQPRPIVPAATGGYAPNATGSPAAATGGNKSSTAHVELADVHQAVSQLRPLHDAFRGSWQSMLGGIKDALSRMPTEAHGFALTILQREFPGLASEPEFAALAKGAGAAVVPASTPSSVGGSAAVQSLARSLCPDDPPPANPADVSKFLSCVEDILRASAKAFVELQRGQEQFGNEMGVRTIKEYTALHAAGTPENVLKYLLDWQSGGPHRTQELVGVYADLMIHQVALINGIMEGVRSLLARLDPEEIERGVTSGWPTRAAATWKQYSEQYKELVEADRNITAIIFGAEFARAYAEVGGEGSS